jgi:hypothetical protein
MEPERVSHMEQTEIFPRRIRGLAIATGIASGFALFPALLLQYPALLIVGGIIQPRFPSTGRWFVWAGAIVLGPVLVTYDVMLFPHPFLQPGLVGLTFPAATILLVWCCAELVVDGLARMRARRSPPPAETQPVGWVAWIVAVALSLWIGRGLYGFLSGYHSGDHHVTPSVLVAAAMTLPLVVIVVAFDIWLISRSIKLRRADV